MSSAWVPRARSVAAFFGVASVASVALAALAALVVAGCGRSELDQGDSVSVGVAGDARVSNDAGHPPSEAGPLPTPDAAPVSPCSGVRRCRGGVVEACDGDGVWAVDPKSSDLCVRPPSCLTPAMGIDDCGTEQEDCCTSIEVPSGSFVRSYDGVSCPGGSNPGPAPALGCYTSPLYPAAVSGFRLDRYLVTVARYRTFLASARASGWLPSAGSGRHDHLNGGRGLLDVGDVPDKIFETGWSPAWADDTLLQDPPDNDNTIPNLPINGVTWAQAYAFCIWDGGFLPSEAEWNYAAAGGDEQRVYPWSVPPKDATINCRHAAYIEREDPDACLASGAYWVGVKSPVGDGRWGHTDLAGSRGEWTLDWLRDYVLPCVDCVNLQAPGGATAASHVVRGYSHIGPTAPPRLLTSLRGDDSDSYVGFRCARLPLSPLPR